MLLRSRTSTMLVTNCCCGCSLKTGTIIIALCYLAASLVQLATMAYRLDTGDYMGGANDQSLQRMFSSETNALLPHPYLDSVEIMYTYSLLIASLVLNIIEAQACSVLLYGAIQESVKFIFPWVIIKTIITCLSSLVMVQMSTAFLADDEFYLPGIIGLIVCGIFMAVSAYFILVVYSFYRSLRQKLVPKEHVVKKSLTVTKQKANGIIMNGAVMNGAAMKGAAMNGTVMKGAAMNGTIINEAAMNEAAMNEAAMNNAVMNGTLMNEAAMNGTAMNAAAMNAAAMNAAAMNAAAMKGAVMKGAAINVAGINSAAMNGTVMNGATVNVAVPPDKNN